MAGCVADFVLGDEVRVARAAIDRAPLCARNAFVRAWQTKPTEGLGHVLATMRAKKLGVCRKDPSRPAHEGKRKSGAPRSRSRSLIPT